MSTTTGVAAAAAASGTAPLSSSSSSITPAAAPFSSDLHHHHHSKNGSASCNVDSGNRLENTVVCLPIVYGSIAFSLAQTATTVATTLSRNNNTSTLMSDSSSTHEWTLYLRAAGNDDGSHSNNDGGRSEPDLSLVIAKVVFHLHPSFAKPVRELTQAPYEVTERGWGEFEAQIRIYWKDVAQEKSTVLTHMIKLYPPPVAAELLTTTTTTTTTTNDDSAPVVSEAYDEVVFTNPVEEFFDLLQKIPTSSLSYPKQEAHDNSSEDKQTPLRDSDSGSMFRRIQYSDGPDFLALLEAQKFLQQELSALQDRLWLVNRDLEQTDDALRQVTTTTSTSPRPQTQSAAGATRTTTAAETKSPSASTMTTTTKTTANRKKQPPKATHRSATQPTTATKKSKTANAATKSQQPLPPPQEPG